MAAGKIPGTIEIRSYQVGFGDCFLVSFKYVGFDRHVLIDFGSMALPKGARGDHMLTIAKQIQADCGRDLSIVVATHRHSDHISGFATNKKHTAPGDVIASLKPKMVIQPWTENPRAPKNAKEAQLTAAVRGFTQSLNDMQAVAATALHAARDLKRAADGEVIRQLAYLGQDNIKNPSAVENLMSMAKNYYVKHGDKVPVGKLLPGVKMHILGPPSLKQSERMKPSDRISSQRGKDANEFWHLLAMAGSRIGTDERILFPKVASRDAPIHAQWFRSHLRKLRAELLLPIVRILDKQMNNTSVILLFEIGDKFLLFPGDAQIENWKYALSQSENVKRLRKVDVYKVGHHGSLNATPKTLWNAFSKRGPAGKPGRLKSVLSTLKDVHGSEHAKTEVPRRTLVTALHDETEFLNTQSFKDSEMSRVVRLRVS